MVSFAPTEITASTLSKLLSLYPTTVANVYREKLLAKSMSRKEKRQEAERRATAGLPPDALPYDPTVPHPLLEKEVDEFAGLDTWRFETLPQTLRERRDAAQQSSSKSGGQDDEEQRPAKRVKTETNPEASGVFLNKMELVRLVDWKLKHGRFRPALLGLARSNTDDQIKVAISKAFNALPDPSEPDPFPETSMKCLVDALRGIGPATASLILSVMPPRTTTAANPDSENVVGIPFFSDELYLWLCGKSYPGDKPKTVTKKEKRDKENIDYTMAGYRQLWNAVREFRSRMQSSILSETQPGGSGTSFSTADLEKVAFVLGHIELSGFKDYEDHKPSVETEEPAQQGKATRDDDGVTQGAVERPANSKRNQ
ncbi:hypothetical protein VTO42DRAFT_7874 [Malbranchea cinnamomea]